jgi:hypothetical protein
MKGFETIFKVATILALFLNVNRVCSQNDQDRIVKVSWDFRFELQMDVSSESSLCRNSKRISINVYATTNDSLIDKHYFCSEQDRLFTENFLEIGDYNFDGHTDFRILIKKSTTLVEKTKGYPEFINDYDFYMFDIGNNKFYHHLISSLRQVKIDPFNKMVTGTLFNNLNNSSTSEIRPTSYLYKFNGEGLKYCTISPLSYPEPNPFFGNFAPTYRILDGRDLRPATEADTLIITPIIKYESGFKFVKIRQIYPRKIDMEKNPNISYRNIYRIYSSTTDQLLSEIIGEYGSLFGTYSDSIYTEDCNFDGYPDLVINYDVMNNHSAIYFYAPEKQSFYEDPMIKQLENRIIDFKNKTITGKVTRDAWVRNKYGQLREPSKKIWQEYEIKGASMKYVKLQTITATPKKRRKVKTKYYIYDNFTLKPIRKKEFLSLTNSI